MLIGVPKEIKNHEYRVGMTPAGVKELAVGGHSVLVETMAGAEVGFQDSDYEQAGAEIAPEAATVFERADILVKVKEPQPEECRMLRRGQTLFTFLHLAPDPDQAALLLDSGATCIAYETVTGQTHGLPLLAPMSEVAGRMAIQAGAHNLEKTQGGNGMLLGGVPGVVPANVLVIGGGMVGINAARMAMGMGARVTVLDRSLPRLQELDMIFGGGMTFIYSTADAIERYAQEADLVVGAVLIPGASAPKLITRELISGMQTGSVLVDVAIDQGGCAETSRATTHQDPTYVVDGVVHYCVANMPGGVARTSTLALTNATLPYIIQLCDRGVVGALRHDPHLCDGLNVHEGKITHQAVAESLGYDYVHPLELLGTARA